MYRAPSSSGGASGFLMLLFMLVGAVYVAGCPVQLSANMPTPGSDRSLAAPIGASSCNVELQTRAHAATVPTRVRRPLQR